jgi:hypothetical protein
MRGCIWGKEVRILLPHHLMILTSQDRKNSLLCSTVTHKIGENKEERERN